MFIATIRRRRLITAILVTVLLLIAICIWKKEHPYLRDLQVIQLVRTQFLLNKSLNKTIRSERIKNPGLILDTPGCRIPKLDAFDPSVADLFEAKEPYPCPGPPLFMSSQPGGSISLNSTVLEEYYQIKPNQIACAYQPIRRKYEKPGNVRENDYDLLPTRRLQFDTPLNEDQIKVLCNLNGKETFIQYFPLIRLKNDVEQHKSSIEPPMPRLNVILAGVDSISKLQFLRHFRKTHAFIKNQKTFFDMKGYTKVGDNTFPNLNPLLTGRFPQDIWNESLADTMYFDDVDIIWKRYSNKGYRTLYAEDSPFFGTFNYGRRGFHESPVDYYLRPLYLALHNSEVREKGPFYCFNSQVEPELMYDYVRDFVRTMGNKRPYFAFAMQSSLTHDYFNHAGYADYPTVKLLEDLWDYGAHNNSVIVLFGDHGLRFGAIRSTYIGKFEERMPFMYIHFPEWFLEQYPEIAKNIRDSQERLVTFFDVHATLIQLLDPTHELTEKEKATNTPYGLSLLSEISPYRTCEKAYIYTHWCVCQVIQEVWVEQPEVKKSADITLECINNELRTDKTSCPTLQLDRITSAKLGQINDLVLRFQKHENVVVDRNVVYGDRIVKYEDYIITFLTNPNGASFESTVRYDVVEETYCVFDIYEEFSEDQDSSCIDVERLKKFRYCNA